MKTSIIGLGLSLYPISKSVLILKRFEFEHVHNDSEERERLCWHPFKQTSSPLHVTWRLLCEVNCNFTDIFDKEFARARQLFSQRTWSADTGNGPFQGSGLFFIFYRGRRAIDSGIHPPYPLTCFEHSFLGEQSKETRWAKGRTRRARESVKTSSSLPSSAYISPFFLHLLLARLDEHRTCHALLLQFTPLLLPLTNT